jgi:hypothetical protein
VKQKRRKTMKALTFADFEASLLTIAGTTLEEASKQVFYSILDDPDLTIEERIALLRQASADLTSRIEANYPPGPGRPAKEVKPMTAGQKAIQPLLDLLSRQGRRPQRHKKNSGAPINPYVESLGMELPDEEDGQ